MTKDLFLRRKWTLRAHGEQIVFVKRANERREHVLMKAFLWALYLPHYPDLAVEVDVNSRYRPDVSAVGPYGTVRFWGEAGHVSPSKIHYLIRHYRSTHFALAKWETALAPFIEIVRDARADVEGGAPFDVLRFASDSAERFIHERGHITVNHGDIDWMRL